MGGETDADLHAFVQVRYPHLRRTAYLLCGDWHRAEDLVQAALARVVVAARRRQVDSLDAYSRRVLMRVFLDDRDRSWRRREHSTAQLTDGQFTGAGAAPDRDAALTVLAALRSLPPRQRAVVVLRYWEDRSVEETAQALGIHQGTVKSQCAKALDALRTVLADLWPAPLPSSAGNGGTR
jgi:RNA polymerase sigma-70 factor (sigma-E family)